MTISSLRFRRGLTVATSFLLTVGTASLAVAAPPKGEQPPAGGDDEEGDVETDEWGVIEGGDQTPPASDDGDDNADDAETETPPEDGGDDDWEDDWDEGGGDEGDDWDGSLVIEDVSDDPEAAIEKVEQVEVEGESGAITGVVKDTTTGDPLMGANVRAIDTPYEVTTDAEGKYTLELPPGTYTIEFFYDAFQAKEISNLEVLADESSSRNVELTPMAGMTSTQEITAEAPKAAASVQLEDRKKSTETKDVMSQEEMKRSGGGNVGNLARLIVGATLDQGRFLIIRGLTHRYGNTLFDGARVSSPNPELRTVPLDIFPSGALSAITIVKTFTPDQPADFTGGSTRLESRDIPDDFTLDLSASVIMNTATTGREFIRDTPVFGDRFAFGNIGRGYPKGFPTKTPVGGSVTIDGESVARHTPEEIEKFGESLFYESPDQRSPHGPGYSLQATLGDGLYLGRGTRFGWVTSARVSDDPEAKRGASGNYNCTGGTGGGPDGSSCGDGFTYNERTDYGLTQGSSAWYSEQNQINGLGLFKFDIRDKHEIYGNALYSRDAESTVRYQRGKAFGAVGNQDVITTRHRYVMRSILFTQLGAKHEIERAKGLEIDYFGSYSQARRDDPGVRDVLYSNTETTPNVFNVTSGIRPPTYQSLFLTDDIGNGAVDFTMPFKQWKQLESSVKVGAWVEGKQRDFESRRFDMAIATGLADQIPQGVGDVVSDDTVGGGLGAGAGGTEPFFLRELTQPEDNYFGRQRLFAGYTMMTLPFVRWFEVSGGARFEHSRIEVGPFDQFNPDADVGTPPAELTDQDFFPSLSLIFKPTDKMNVRMVGTQTIARPEFRELAPFSFTDFVGGTQTQGNRFLNSTRIWNADLRWEFFPSGEEVVAASAFFKWFDAPIERALAAGASTNLATFLNSEFAYNVGGEVEVKKNLGFLGRRSKKNGGGTKDNLRWLEDLSLGANFAYIYSEVRLPTARNSETGEELPAGTPLDECPVDDDKCRLILQFSAASSASRPLQGQSPWIANGFIDYDNDEIGLNTRLIYNAFGRRIRQLGGRGQGDEYQLPVHTLDVVFSQRIFRVADNTDAFLASNSHELRFKAQVGNILNWKREWGQFDDAGEFFQTQSYRDGVDFQVGLSYSF